MAGEARNSYYQSTPQLGFYCLYRKRPNEAGYMPDCLNISSTLRTHAKWLLDAGINFIATDSTNLGTQSVDTDVFQVRPTQVIFEEWHNLRSLGIPTPSIAVWNCLPAGANVYQIYLDTLYNNQSYSDLVLKDPKTGKKVWFTTETPDPSLVSTVESNGGRNDIIVQKIWALFSPSVYDQGLWSFMSPCVNNGVQSTSVAQVPCNQYETKNSNLGTQMSVSPAYQLMYGSLPFQSSGKLRGLCMKKQFQNVFQAQPDWLFLSSWNEPMAQPQPNPFQGKVNTAFSLGLPNDPMRANLFVDTYGVEYSRDIEPSVELGNYYLNLVASCLRILRSGAKTCNNPAEECCDMKSSDVWNNVWSLTSTRPDVFDNLITSSELEYNTLIRSGNYKEICNPFTGPGVFCVQETFNGQSGPFMIYSTPVNSKTATLYRCRAGTQHFFSTSPTCENQVVEAVLGYISTVRWGETPRALYRCRDPVHGNHYHSLDLPCPSSDHDTGVFGYVR
eukprot:TRINITY_DN4485_c0_g1_i2.p1 TRINITY_DN4485_c0_g1~~TRINITY_DN4485_c0_g1_i2.p1  ORF type:complete len:586 (-),score=88.64 TRINITY_DN4485_c0_g1_i2:53-1558(-)